MLAFSLLILSICIATILLSIHDDDEIHQLVALLSGLIALICIFILTPPLVKGLLGIFCLTMGHKIFLTYSSFK
ncbi:MAG TPA: hypothetical protein ACFCUY_01105 [Xenococcaceae cyanobacterium]|jgi:nicotinamide riboside transporter PnuC